MSRNPVNLLALDTSTPLLSVALKKGRAPIREKSLQGLSTHSENLLPLIDEILKEAGICLSDVDAFLIDRGPGSFTGLRIGFAALKAFRAVNRKTCYGASSLDMIANGIPFATAARLCVALDAHRSGVYFRTYRCGKEDWIPEDKPRVLAAEDFAAQWPKETAVAGDAVARYGKLLDSKMPAQKTLILPVHLWYPRASTLIRCLERQNTRKQSPVLIQKMIKSRDFIPQYLRLSEAEERKKAACRRSLR